MDVITYVVEKSDITPEEFAKAAGISVKKLNEQLYGLRNLQPNLLRAILEKTNEDADKIYLRTKYPNISLEGLNLKQVLTIMELIHPEFFSRKRLKPRKHDLQDIQNDMGYRIRFIRETIISLSQDNLGKVIGISRDSSKSWDVGSLSVPRIIQISMMTNISINYIILNNHSFELNTYHMSSDMYLAVLCMRNIYRKRNQE